MTIRLMLRLVFGFTVAISVVLLLITLLLKSGLIESEQAASDRYDLTNLAKLSATNSAQLTKLARQHVVTLKPEYEAAYNLLVKQIEGKAPWNNGRQAPYIDLLKEFDVAENDLALLAQSNSLSMALVNTEVAAFNLIKPFVGQLVTNLTPEQHEKRNKAIEMLYDASYESEVKKIAQPVGEFINTIEKKSLQNVMDTTHQVEILSALSISAVILIIVVLVLCYLQLEKRVIKTTKNLVFEANRIASGDLSHKIEFSGKDEISQLSQSFNAMVEKLAELLTEITKQSEQAQSSSNELDQIAREARNLNDEQNEAIGVISSSVYENSVAVKEVARNCVSAAESAANVESQTTEGEQVVRQGIESVENVASVMGAAIERLSDLEKSVEEVTAILNVISNIAEQTNLLALNAAIEAARAGEQGRGFAVVADEVRTLASRTQSSTIEIKDKINTLQNVSSSVTQSIHSSDGSVKQAVENSERIGEMLNAITGLVKGILDMNQSIATASEEQSKVTDDIAERLTKIRDGSVQSKQQTVNISHSSDELSQVASTLTTQVKRFILPKH